MSDVVRTEMKRLRAAHEPQHGLKSALARATGVTPTSAGEWLNGVTPPSEKYWPAIERFFKLQPGHLAALAYDAKTAEQITHALASTQPSEGDRAVLEMFEMLRAEIASLRSELAELREQPRSGAGRPRPASQRSKSTSPPTPSTS